MYEAFIDLDELVLLCRDKVAKKFIREAVVCYRSGAFRSCIVATWNAVVFDFIHKLRELELFGNGEADILLKKFDDLRLGEKFQELWQFESNIPSVAREKFELISPVEESDIKRLFEDRSRCAHPSMTSLEEPFEATAELARYHLRSAVTHLLQRPPVQGNAAKDAIFRDIKSEYFPVNVDQAVKHFQKSPLTRARVGLIRSIVLGLTVSLLKDDLSEDERTRQFCAINAISVMYPQEIREILNDKLSDIILNKITDKNLGKAVIYLDSIKAWDNLDERCQIKIEKFVEKLSIFDENKNTDNNKEYSQANLNILLKAIHISFLKEAAIKKFQLPISDLLFFKKMYKDKLPDEIVNPLLSERASQATLKQLMTIRAEDNISLNEQIKPYFIEKIGELSLKRILLLGDELLDFQVQSKVKEKINNANLNELFEARSKIVEELEYLDVDEDNSALKLFLEQIDSLLPEVIKKNSLDELLILNNKYYSKCSFEKFVKLKLTENIDAVIEKFIKSYSFDNAVVNSKLLVNIYDSLDISQWEKIFDAFCENSQIYQSFDCPGIFCDLFQKSVNANNKAVQSHWQYFRKKLNSFNDNYIYIEKLKALIDSYL